MSSDDSDEEEFKDETSTSTRPVGTTSTVQRGDTSAASKLAATAAADNWDNESGNDSGDAAAATATGKSGAGSGSDLDDADDMQQQARVPVLKDVDLSIVQLPRPPPSAKVCVYTMLRLLFNVSQYVVYVDTVNTCITVCSNICIHSKYLLKQNIMFTDSWCSAKRTPLVCTLRI
jgi:hypothetical protein